MTRETKFEQWVGRTLAESDGGWTEEVWNAAWDYALLEAADRLEQMFEKSDTIASIAVWLRQLKEE